MIEESSAAPGTSRGSANLEGRVAFVTGASAGIGRAIAGELAACGATTVVNARAAERADEAVAEIRARGHEAWASVGDVADGRQVDPLIDGVVEAHGRLDILVNNAGVGKVAPSTELAVEDWQAVVDLNLTAPFLCARAAARHMLAGDGGVIVNISSIFGHVGMPERAAYSATKHGLAGLTRTLAAEWAPTVRCVSVDPAYVETELVRKTMAAGGFDAADVLGRTPAGRFGTPDEVARIVAFVASDAASYISGSSIVVDGGWLAYGGW